ncbi:hypothetical protein A3D09_01530 [Candidatus Collierbacteria bacterium RIFCSPHIGHO2_02_FULL_49_10]|uniref:N-acetyltransferase domain-containing protein n=1 Tax=Candidatus Collierbacteria bacterium RIFCSPHIGHO2_02_FULL_49_10 TaxID=1817723 RepID=A0A1F5EX00_9BACT|nr:MAG: hypothetical protein A3D09_01530 [Candidatus Collierbacteria bacterium RIFCSPHIGHO2_02_FULL_49_10]
MKERFFGSRIYFRKLTESDATPEYAAWLNDPEVNLFLETRKATVEELKIYIGSQNRNKNCVFLGVFDRTNDKHVGNVRLEPVDWEKKRATLGIVIGNKEYWGKGIGTEATKLAVDYAFQKLGLDEVELGVISENVRARKTFEKAGFKLVRIERRAMNHDGTLYDKVVMAVKKGDK